MFGRSARFVVVGLFLLWSTASFSQFSELPSKVRIYSREEFLKNIFDVNDFEFAVNFAEHFESLNYSADADKPTKLTEMLKSRIVTDAGGAKYLEGVYPSGKSYSQGIFENRKFLPWDRTVSAGLALRAIVRADAKWLGTGQDPALKITDENAKDLAKLENRYLQTVAPSAEPVSREAFAVNLELLAMHDAFKKVNGFTNVLLEKLLASGRVKDIDHDEILKTVVDNESLRNELFPGMGRHGPVHQESLIEAAKILANWGQLVQLELTPDALEKMCGELRRASPKAAALFLAHVLPDMAGVVPLKKGTVILTSPKVANFLMMLDSVEEFTRGKSAAEVMRHYIDQLEQSRYPRLGEGLPEAERILLIELAEHYEAYTPEKQKELREAFENMDRNLRDVLVREKVILCNLQNPESPATNKRAQVLIYQAPKLVKFKGASLVERLETLAQYFEKGAELAQNVKGTVVLDVDPALKGARLPEIFKFDMTTSNYGRIVTGEELVARCAGK